MNNRLSIFALATLSALASGNAHTAAFRVGGGVGYANHTSRSGFDLNVLPGGIIAGLNGEDQKELASGTKHTGDFRIFLGIEHYVNDFYFGGELGYRFLPGQIKTTTRANQANDDAGLDEPFIVTSSLKHTIYADAHLGGRLTADTTLYGILGARIAFHKADMSSNDGDVENGIAVKSSLFGGAIGLGVSHTFTEDIVGSVEGTYEFYQKPSQSGNVYTDDADKIVLKTVVEQPRVLSLMFKVSKKI